MSDEKELENQNLEEQTPEESVYISKEADHSIEKALDNKFC